MSSSDEKPPASEGGARTILDAPHHLGTSGASRIDTLSADDISMLLKKALLTGDTIGNRYKLVEMLGHGAMGQVWLAENLAIGRRVAIKVLKRELLADPSFRRRFQQEAEAIAAIEHRNVARFLDLVVGDPTFIVMEYIKGPTLSAVLREKGRLPFKQALSIVRRLCWALEVAHRAGVVHRDIKPSNVVLAPDPEVVEEPKLIDFGLAKLASATESQSGPTRTGQVVGTPAYMSPEQIANINVDPRSDVYSLACLLYELVAGRPPFGGEELQMLFKHMHATPDPLDKHVPEAPQSLSALLARALSKEPVDRPQSMAEFSHELSAIEKELDGQAAPAPTPPPASRKRLLVGAGLGAGLLGAALGVVGSAAILRKPAVVSSGAAVMILTRPSGAAVKLDGVALGETTPTLARGLASGRHTLSLAKAGYTAVDRPFTLDPDERTDVEVVLPTTRRHIELQTVPGGATVYLDGKLVLGTTPTSVDVTVDDFHELRIERSGYEPVSQAVRPDDKDPLLTLNLLPEEKPRGRLIVEANGVADVWLDGVDTGFTTPTIPFVVPAGEHSIELRDSTGARSSVNKVKLGKGETQRVIMDVTSNCTKGGR